MTTINALDAITDDLLARWHSWKSGYTTTRGHRSTSATCGDAQSAWSAYDRENGVPQEDYELSEMKAVDRAVERIPNVPQAWHTMILVEARNLHSGVAVWSSFRLPGNDDELEVLRIEARNKLMVEFRREGLLGG